MRTPLLLALSLSFHLGAAATAQLTWRQRNSGLGDTLNDVAFGMALITGQRQCVAVRANNTAPTVATSHLNLFTLL